MMRIGRMFYKKIRTRKAWKICNMLVKRNSPVCLFLFVTTLISRRQWRLRFFDFMPYMACKIIEDLEENSLFV